MASNSRIIQDTTIGNHATVNLGDITHIHNGTSQDKEDAACLRDLFLTNPRDDKVRIENTKGGLLQDSYRWILDHPQFLSWYSNSSNRLLWIRGDPGKGKTMLLCGIIDEISLQASEPAYFFCQATDEELNNATAVLRGLVYLLCVQHPELIHHVQADYSHAGKALFNSNNTWAALSKILGRMLSDPALVNKILVLDALDECSVGMSDLLDFIARVSSTYPVKWLVSSRNWPDIEGKLRIANHKIMLQLELNHDSISSAVRAYISYKMNALATTNEYDDETRVLVEQHLVERSNDTFLWAALVCQELEVVDAWDAEEVIKNVPANLTGLYARMMQQILQLGGSSPDLCQRILSTVATAYRPLHLAELAQLSRLPPRVSKTNISVSRLVAKCGSFLTIRDSIVYAIHQSAQEFLVSNTNVTPAGQGTPHHAIFTRSLEILKEHLKRDICSLQDPGIYIEDITATHDLNPLVPLRYASVHWVDHLRDSSHEKHHDNDPPQDIDMVYSFLQSKFLNWLEAMSLLRSLPQAILAVQNLAALSETKRTRHMADLIEDFHRFIQHHGGIIATAPLQTYLSALVFSPCDSLVRRLYEHELESSFAILPRMEMNWSPFLATLEGHTGGLISVAFAPDGRLASAGYDSVVKVWDPTAGLCLATLEGHEESVSSVAFTPDGRLLASASWDMTVKIWDPATSQCLATLKGHRDAVNSVAFSPDGCLASGSDDHTVKFWDPASGGTCLRTLENHRGPVHSVAFAQDGRLSSSDSSGTINIWDPTKGVCLATFYYGGRVRSVAFSPDGRRLAVACDNKRVQVRDSATGDCLTTIYHGHDVTSVAFSPDGQRLASASWDETVKLWDPDTGECFAIFHDVHRVTAVAFSPNGRNLASASQSHTVKVWDPTLSTCVVTADDYHAWETSRVFTADKRCLVPTIEGHTQSASSMAFTPDGKCLASASADGTVMLWAPITGALITTLEDHDSWAAAVAISPDGRKIASGSRDNLIKMWDLATHACIATLEGHTGQVTSVAFSPNSQWLASGSGSKDNTVKIWDTATDTCVTTLGGHSASIRSLEFAPDGQHLASASYDMTIKVWDMTTNACITTIQCHPSAAILRAFSPDGQRLAIASLLNGTVEVVSSATGALLATLEFHGDHVKSLGQLPALSHDSGNLDLTFYDRKPGLVVDQTSLDLAFRYTAKSEPCVDFGVLETDPWATVSALNQACPSLYHSRGLEPAHLGDWITRNGRRFLWLPREYRPNVMAVSGSLLAMNCDSGRVLFYGLR